MPDPGMLPDHPLYFLKNWYENIQTTLTFGDLAKANRYAELAEIRLAEARALAEKGNIGLANESIQRYKDSFAEATAQIETANNQKLNTTEIIDWLTDAYQRHQHVLAEVYERAPEQAKPAIQRAMNNSARSYEHAIELLKNLPTNMTIPENYTEIMKEQQEVKRRINDQNRSIPLPTPPTIEEIKERMNKTDWNINASRLSLSIQASSQDNKITVTVKASGIPISEAEIYVNDEKIGITDQNGQLTLQLTKPAKVKSIKAMKSGFLTASATVSIGYKN